MKYFNPKMRQVQVSAAFRSVVASLLPAKATQRMWRLRAKSVWYTSSWSVQPGLGADLPTVTLDLRPKSLGAGARRTGHGSRQAGAEEVRGRKNLAWGAQNFGVCTPGQRSPQQARMRCPNEATVPLGCAVSAFAACNCKT